MTDNRLAPNRGAKQRAAITAFLLSGLSLAACSPAQTGSKLRTYAVDLSGGAKVCDVPVVNPTKGAVSEVAMKVGNDGGWCGIRLHQPGPEPYAAGLLITRSDHGSVTIHSVGDDTRIDYTPDRGYAGKDDFKVKLIPGDVTVHVAVTVAGASAQA